MKDHFSIEKECCNNQLHVTLKGDMDGNGAWELLNDLKENCTDVNKVVIQTKFLSHMYPFARRLVMNHLYLLKRPLNVIDSDKESHQIIIEFKKKQNFLLAPVQC